MLVREEREMRAALILVFTTVAPAFGQTVPKEHTDALEALLIEVRQLRQDIESMTIASQRVQIALSGLQFQNAALARSSQRLDDLRSKRMQSEQNRDSVAAEAKRLEAAIGQSTADDAESKALKAHFADVTRTLESLNSDLQLREAAETEAASQFRAEQVKLSELQDRIERLDDGLQKLGAAVK
jgi:valyl-tRNA synthetase